MGYFINNAGLMGQPLQHKLVFYLSPIISGHEDHRNLNMKEYFDHPKVGKVLLSMMCYLEIIKENIDKFGYMKIKNLGS